jgi:predicted XRE-type DNA-binding protein
MRIQVAETRVTPSSGNVFVDLGFDEAEAQVLTLRADVMLQIYTEIKSRKLTQVEAARLLGVSQSRVSDLMRGKAEKFSLDTLVLFAVKLGIPTRLQFAA